MIVTKLSGGLGNQMFQYAAGRALAAHHKTALGLDISWFENQEGVAATRNYELDCFMFQPNFMKPNEIQLLTQKTGLIRDKLVTIKYPHKKRLLHYVEDGFAFNDAFNSLPNNTYLDGYWQSEKYFVNHSDVIYGDFGFAGETTGKNKSLHKQINSVNAISLHIRRGDYVSHKATNTFHGLTGMDYYEAAAANITKIVDDPHFFIFSDDPEWCKKNLRLKQPTTYIDHNKAGFEDMRLMAQCRHNIIANSSFSWWGAWLNPNPEKIIIGPKQWFADNSIDTSDIIPKKWIKL